MRRDVQDDSEIHYSLGTLHIIQISKDSSLKRKDIETIESYLSRD